MSFLPLGIPPKHRMLFVWRKPFQLGLSRPAKRLAGLHVHSRSPFDALLPLQCLVNHEYSSRDIPNHHGALLSTLQGLFGWLCSRSSLTAEHIPFALRYQCCGNTVCSLETVQLGCSPANIRAVQQKEEVRDTPTEPPAEKEAIVILYREFECHPDELKGVFRERRSLAFEAGPVALSDNPVLLEHSSLSCRSGAGQIDHSRSARIHGQTKSTGYHDFELP